MPEEKKRKLFRKPSRRALLAAGGLVAAAGDDALQLLTDARLNERLPSDQRATLISVSSLCFSLTMAVLSPLAGWLVSL